jgi:uncharacterized protein (TIGR03437 family)
MQFRNDATRVLQFLALAAMLPLAAWARSNGPPVMRTGAAVDGGLTCTACHRTFAQVNSGAGKVAVTAASYTPGVKQNITITVEDPDANRWGFEVTARTRSDENKTAGAFTAVADRVRVACEGPGDGAAPPCNGLKEFATQVTASSQQGTKGKGTWTVEWTPPAEDVGEVIFYVAGNAADGTATNANDRIYTSSTVIRPACNITAKPTVSGASDSASGRAISGGALVSVYGSGFSSSRSLFVAAGSDLVGGKVDTKLGCVAVEIGGRRAPVWALNNTQINIQAPPIDAAGNVNVVVIANPGTSNELRSDARAVTAAALSPAFFVSGGKYIAARNASKSNQQVLPATPAAPGDVVVLYGTGFGATNPNWGTGEFPDKVSPLTGTVTVTIGGVTLQPADILYAGAAGDAPGFYQFNLRLPASLPDGDAAVKITVGGFSTQDGTVIPVTK